MAAIFSKYIPRWLVLLTMLAPAPARAECFKQTDNLFEQGRGYFHRGQYLLAAQQFSIASLLSCAAEDQENARLRWAQSLFELGEVEEGNLLLDKITAKSTYSNQARIIRAWYQPTLISTLPESDRNRFQSLNEQTLSLPNPKNPWVAGSLSAIIPGLGQVYNGNFQSAAFSFVLNAIFLSATVELSEKNLDSTALAAGAVFSVVYVGNIVGSAQSAKSINRNSQEQTRATLRRNILPELSF